MILRRRVRMIRHNLRHSGMLALILEGMIEGKNWEGSEEWVMRNS